MHRLLSSGYINQNRSYVEAYSFSSHRKRYISVNMKAVFVALFALFALAYGGVVLPHAYSVGIAPYGLPLAYSAPIVAAPAVQSGYVAANRGAVHTAPLPEGPFAFSHHINTAPAPGTF